LQVAAELDLPLDADFATMESLQRLLVLEGVQDPGNMVRREVTARALLPQLVTWYVFGHPIRLTAHFRVQGTLLRTATALGWQGAFLLPGCCDAFNDKALRAGRCAAFKLPHASGSWDELLHIVAARQLTCLAAQLPERSGEPL
jgi:tRNA G18 (ribose-2'-O)-methylase SpoU